MIVPIATLTASLTTSIIAAGVSGCVRAAAGRPASRPVRVVHRTSEGAVARLMAALDSEKVRRAAAEDEVARLREELEAARDVIDLLV